MFIHTLLSKKTLKKSTAMIAVSDFVKNKLVSNGLNPGNIHVIYNPTLIKSDIKTRPNAPCILYVGRLDLEKGVEFLLKAFRKICTSIEKVKLIILGRGRREKALRSLAKSLKIEEHVKFLSKVSNDQLLRLYESSTLVVVPSIWAEPFGIVVAEAIMCNRPVVASNVGGLSELVSSEVGVLVPPGDSESLAEGILSMISNRSSLDTSSLRQKFSSDYVASQYLTVIKSVSRKD